jgi:hypothetical protein
MSATTGKPQRRLTPSLIIASLALVVASSGSAVAAALITGANIKNESVTGKDIKNGSLGFGELDSAAKKKATKQVTPLWAYVAADGTLLRGKGVVSVERIGDGLYFVTFVRDITKSGVSASVVSDGSGLAQINWRFCGFGIGCSTNPLDDPRAAFVNTEDSAGTNVDRPFSVVVDPGGVDFVAPRPSLRSPAKGAEGR